MNRCILSVGLSAALLLPAFSVAAQQLQLQQCQRLKDDIARYTQLRREGGPSAQMDAWKRARRDSERAFRDGSCSQYRWELE